MITMKKAYYIHVSEYEENILELGFTVETLVKYDARYGVMHHKDGTVAIIRAVNDDVLETRPILNDIGIVVAYRKCIISDFMDSFGTNRKMVSHGPIKISSWFHGAEELDLEKDRDIIRKDLNFNHRYIMKKHLKVDSIVVK